MQALFVRDGEIFEGSAVYELGIYGIFLGGGAGRVLHNTGYGHLLRTKLSTSNEGGVAAGFAVLSSPLLVGKVNREDQRKLTNAVAEDTEHARKVFRDLKLVASGWILGTLGITAAVLYFGMISGRSSPPSLMK